MVKTQRTPFVTLIFAFALLASCSIIPPPDVAPNAGAPEISKSPRRIARFFQSFLPILFDWSSDSSDPLATMCGNGYTFTKSYAYISNCTQLNGKFISAIVTLGPGFPNTVSHLYQGACENDDRQGFQSVTTTFNLTVDSSTGTTLIEANLEGTLYALDSSWYYWPEGLAQISIGNRLFFRRSNTTDAYAFECVTGSSEIVINDKPIDCQSVVSLFSAEACVPLD